LTAIALGELECSILGKSIVNPASVQRQLMLVLSSTLPGCRPQAGYQPVRAEILLRRTTAPRCGFKKASFLKPTRSGFRSTPTLYSLYSLLKKL